MGTCLVIDDSRVIRKVARRILEDLGFMVEEAEDGQAGIERCRAGMPDAVLVDSVMPVLDGVGFLRALKRDDRPDKPKVLFCTTENDDAHVAQARAAGAADVLFKPFDKETLEQKLVSAGIMAAR